MRLLPIIPCCFSLGLLHAFSVQAMDINLTKAQAEIRGKSSVVLRNISVPGKGKFDAELVWNAATGQFDLRNALPAGSSRQCQMALPGMTLSLTIRPVAGTIEAELVSQSDEAVFDYNAVTFKGSDRTIYLTNAPYYLGGSWALLTAAGGWNGLGNLYQGDSQLFRLSDFPVEFDLGAPFELGYQTNQVRLAAKC